MSRVGEVDGAEAFFGWCDRILTNRSAQILDLAARGGATWRTLRSPNTSTRYTVDGVETGTEWQDFQLDGYGTWLWALDEHSRRHRPPAGRVPGRSRAHRAVPLRVLGLPFYDWWEEHGDQRHPSSLAAIRAGLLAAASWPELDAQLRERAEAAALGIAALIETEGIHDGHLTKQLGSTEVDGSLIACITPFRLYPAAHPVAIATAAVVERDLAPGGVYRFLADTFYGGGEWCCWPASSVGTTAPRVTASAPSSWRTGWPRRPTAS